MKLASLLEKGLITISPEVSPTGKSAVELLDLLISGDTVDRERLLEKLNPQIQRGGLSLGGNVSMFHLTIPEIGDSRLAVKLMGGETGVFTFLLSTPRIAPKFYLQVAAALRAMAGDNELLKSIRLSRNANDFMASLESSSVIVNPRIEVKDVMRRKPTSVDSEATLNDVVALMVFEGMGGLVVTDSSRKVLGVITESDLVGVFIPELMATMGESDQREIESSTHGDIGERYKVKNFMARSVMCVSEDTPITEVATLMVNKKVRRIPVVTEGKLVGIISLQDIISKVLRGWFV